MCFGVCFSSGNDLLWLSPNALLLCSICFLDGGPNGQAMQQRSANLAPCSLCCMGPYSIQLFFRTENSFVNSLVVQAIPRKFLAYTITGCTSSFPDALDTADAMQDSERAQSNEHASTSASAEGIAVTWNDDFIAYLPLSSATWSSIATLLHSATSRKVILHGPCNLRVCC